MQWYASSTDQEQYLYDASGERMLRRFTNSNGTTILTYPFGIEEHQYSGSGCNQWNMYYYSLAGHLLGSLDGNGTTFYLTDALGSLVSDFNNAAGGASLKGNRLFRPYGNGRYYGDNINTAKGFIGQYNDGLTGLDYLHARYYDPVVGVFLSADGKQGNLQGMNPYAYVGGNPETYSDPTGQMPCSGPDGYCGWPKPSSGGGGTSGAISIDIVPHSSGKPNAKSTQPSTPSKKAGECTIDPESCRVKAWALDAEKVRQNRIDSLNFNGNLKALGAAVLLLLGDILAFSNGAEPLIERLDALIQIGVDIVSNILPLVGALFGGAIYEGVLHFGQWASAALAGVKGVLVGINSTVWWISDAAQFAGTALIDSLGGPVELAVQGVVMLTKPAIGYLLGLGSYALQSAAYADYSEAQRESDMSIQDWCAQYGGCRPLSSY